MSNLTTKTYRVIERGEISYSEISEKEVQLQIANVIFRESTPKIRQLLTDLSAVLEDIKKKV